MRNLALFLLTVSIVAGAEKPAEWTPELSMKVTAVGDVVPSADGRLAVWTQRRAIMEKEKSENLTHIFLGTADGSRTIQLTRGEKSATSPSFSPDGRFVYFSSKRSGKAGLYRIAVRGGEAVRILEWKGALGGYRLSPDGKWIAFTARRPDKQKDKAKKEKLDFRVVDADPPNLSLWVVSADPGGARSHPPTRLFQTNYHVAGFRWSPDSRRIAFEHRPSPAADFRRRADIAEVDVETGVVKELLHSTASESSPRYSPDGTRLAFVKTLGSRASELDGSRIVVLDLETGKQRMLAASFDEGPDLMGWAADGNRLIFSEPRRTRTVLYAMPMRGEPEILYEPKNGTLGWQSTLNTSGTCAGIVRQDPVTPAEAFLFDISSKTVTRLSKANTDLSLPPLGETRVIEWASTDGTKIQGLLTLPVGYKKGTRVPLVLNIHGGPSGVYQESFIGAPALYPIATFASKGYAVLRCNPRGSTGYGQPFRAAIELDWGGKDYQDLMTGVDHVIQLGIADPDRLAVMGWSYGGYMTAWTITQTRRFKAAVIGAGITNVVSMWATNDIPTVLDDYFDGPFWKHYDLYTERSALTHVTAVKTPTLILHGAEDPRVPTTQAYEYYNALKRCDVPVEMVTYPRTEHGPREPKFVLDIMRRHLKWVEDHLK